MPPAVSFLTSSRSEVTEHSVGDPSLTIALPSGDGHVDEAGRRVRLPVSGVTPIDESGAVIVHDPAALADPEAVRNQVVADTIKIVSTSLLGLSVGCAQCHDHRYDPIPQTDYYRIRAVLEPAYDPKNWRTPDQRLVSLYTDADRAKAAAIDAEAAAMQADFNQKQSTAVRAA